jgi:DNA replication licensing factor MCM5
MFAGGWDNAQIYSTSVYPNEQQEDSQTAIKAKFVDFLRNFRLDNIFVYRSKDLIQRSAQKEPAACQ